MATVAAHAAVDKLAANVIVIDVSEQLVITDCFVIASADNERQVASIVDEIEEKLREAGTKPVRREGTREGRWTLLDYIDVVVHVLHNEEREFYALERLWKDCPIIDIPGIEPAKNVGGRDQADGDDFGRDDSGRDDSDRDDSDRDDVDSDQIGGNRGDVGE